MKAARFIAALGMILSTILPAPVFSDTIRKWEDVLNSNIAVNIYVENVTNDSGNTVVSADTVTRIIKDTLEKRRRPKFNVVSDKAKADIIFNGVITEYLWMEKAPVTDVYGAGALALDVATAHTKNYARMQMEIAITAVATGKQLYQHRMQVTLKRKGIPEDKSYGMIYDRLPKILALELFTRAARGRD